jgi:hypothetical protein
MKTITQIFVILLLFGSTLHAQKYITKNGHISFFSSTPMEDIEAHNQQVNAVLDTETGDFVFKVLIKSFEFEKALMQEHFNENYMESHKIPNSTFVGKVTNHNQIDFDKDGEYPASIEGKLTIHGVTKEVGNKGKFIVKDGEINGVAKFNIAPSDYDIKIPAAVAGKIANSLEVSVDIKLKPLK